MTSRARTSIADVLRKFRGRSTEEFWLRGLQLGRKWLERLELSPDVEEPTEAALWRRLSPSTRDRVRVGDAGSLLADYRMSGHRIFFPGFLDRDATVRELRRRWPEAEAGILTRADGVRAGAFDLLGYRGLSFGDPIDWHRDPVANLRGPRTHWSQIPYLDSAVIGDHKVIWELNRHQHFLTLGRAYWLTGDETYARSICEHLSSWMDANPPKIGVNWASSLEVSYRAMSWLWALNFLRESPELTPPLYGRVLAYLDLHARHVAAFLSTYFSPNTHLTGEALGLFVLGSCLPQLAGAQRWRELGQFLLEDQLSLQIRLDGVYVEQSPHYHRYTLDIYLAALALSRVMNRPLRVSEPRLLAAFDHAMFLTMPDGTFPLVGDDDGGQLYPFNDAEANDFRPALAMAAALYARNDYAAVSGGPTEQTLWLLGPAGLSAFDQLTPIFPTATSRAFSDGGFYIMRDGWTADSSYALFDAGPHGFLSCGHAHADALSIVMSMAGKQVFVDPGTFVYGTHGRDRDRFRASAAHNTVTVDAASSSMPGRGPFQWEHIATTQARYWLATPRFDFVEASHDGFMRLPSPVRHERSVMYVKGHYWVIRDRLIGEGDHTYDLHFHCAPGVEASIQSARSLVLRVGSELDAFDVALTTFAADGTFELSADWVSPQYGRKVATTTCTFRARGSGTTEIVTFALPMGATLRQVVCSMSNVFEVSGGGGRHTVCIGASAGEIESDAAWTWIRRDPVSDDVLEYFLIGGGRLAVGGVELVNLPQATGLVDGCLAGSPANAAPAK